MKIQMDLIDKLHCALNMIKDFAAGYSTATASDGYIMIEYKGERYAVKIIKMEEEDQKKDGWKAIDYVKYYF